MAGLLGLPILLEALAALGQRYDQAKGLLSNPSVTLRDLAQANAAQRADDRSWVGASQSVMPEVRDAAMQRVGSAALSAGGLLTVKPVGDVWFKGMYPHDWTRETPTDPGPLIDPSNIKRDTPFPTFNGDASTLDGIRGFFAKDPAVASRFAQKNGAVYPVKISADDAKVLEIDTKGANAGDVQFGKTGKKFQDAVRSGKYETIVIRNTKDEGDIAVALNGSQIDSIFKP